MRNKEKNFFAYGTKDGLVSIIGLLLLVALVCICMIFG